MTIQITLELDLTVEQASAAIELLKNLLADISDGYGEQIRQQAIDAMQKQAFIDAQLLLDIDNQHQSTPF